MRFINTEKERRMAQEKEKSGKISRREFLKDAGLMMGGATIGSMSVMNACSGGGDTTETVTSTVTKTSTVTVTSPSITQMTEVSASVKVVKLTVNGEGYEVEVRPNMTLQEMLRDRLGIMSPKDMCFGYGACGTCSVIMNGRPILSCMALATQCDGAVIETAEGIADADHPLIESYIKHHCMQCGYCTPGFLVTAKALLDRNPHPDEEDIRDILAGSICRCGTYPAHIKAILEVA
jgi:aerobic-type carbon monoxide dehydrogenase small subunit (CoxS/CutS family)